MQPPHNLERPQCECGCGGYTHRQTNGSWSRWLPGHNMRFRPNESADGKDADVPVMPGQMSLFDEVEQLRLL